MEISNEIKELARELKADGIKKGKNYKGYTVYEPVYNKECFIGLPLVIFVKDNKARICTNEESLAYLDFINGNN